MISGRRLFGRSHLLTFRSKQRQQSSFDTHQIDLITRWILGSRHNVLGILTAVYGPYYIYCSSGLGRGPSRPMRRPATVTVSPNTSPILMLPAATTGSRFKVLGALLGNFATASRLESGPFPPARSRGVQRDPTTKIAGGQVAGNSNLKLGDRPRTVTVTTN